MDATARFIGNYCLSVMGLFFAFIKRTHGAIAIGAPALVYILAGLFLPIWVSYALVIMVLLPASAGMAMLIAKFFTPRSNP